jgi:response regulator RpfG family c-di-GMP phosphodiesterase
MADQLRVLVADDNAEIRGLLKEVLEAERCHVTVCPDGASALMCISQEPFHLILCDIVMPGASGLEVLEKSKAVAAGIPLVLITGYVEAESAIFALRHGAFDYLSKPFQLEEIRDLLRRVRRLSWPGVDVVGERAPGLGKAHPERQQEVLIKRSRALDLVASTGMVLGEIHELGRLLEVILELAMRGGRARQGALFLTSRCRSRLRVAAIKGFGGAVAVGDELESEQELWSLAGQTSHAPCAVPLVVRGEQVGTIILADSEREECRTPTGRAILQLLAQQASMALESTCLYATLEDSIFEGMRSLVMALESKDPYTEGHSLRVSIAAVHVCRRMGLGRDVEDTLRYAGALHDIGKVGVPDAVLMKTGKLTPEEYEQMKTHPVVGWNILMPFSFLQEEAVIVRHHHEWISGAGYPDGLRGTAIPLPARILAVADAYDAMTTIRPYRPSRSHEAALEELRRCSGTQFDPEVVEVFTAFSPLELSQPAASRISPNRAP